MLLKINLGETSIVLCIPVNDGVLICRMGTAYVDFLSIIQMAEKAFLHEVLISQKHTDKGFSFLPRTLD